MKWSVSFWSVCHDTVEREKKSGEGEHQPTTCGGTLMHEILKVRYMHFEILGKK